VINEFANASATRSWRDIPQPVKPRAMSSGGRRRRMTAGMKSGALVLFAAAIAWGGWLLAGVLRQSPGHIPAALRSVPIRIPELRTNGVLGPDWLARRLALPKNASLMELDLDRLRSRLMADRQVISATLTRNFPDRLVVTLTERSPVARLMAELQGRQLALLVAPDGVVFSGEGHEAAMIEQLPWLDGIKLSRQGSDFTAIPGMDVVAELLARNRETEPRGGAADPRRIWSVISLARLAADREIEVRTLAGTTVVFAVQGDFLRQLAKLDYLWDALVSLPAVPARIDLTLGREVPVMVGAPAIAAGTPAGPIAFPLKTRSEF
jgi:POTRA domain, FtsQ-type